MYRLFGVIYIDLKKGKKKKKKKKKKKQKKNAKCHFTKITNKSLNTYSIVRLCQ